MQCTTCTTGTGVPGLTVILVGKIIYNGLSLNLAWFYIYAQSYLCMVLIHTEFRNVTPVMIAEGIVLCSEPSQELLTISEIAIHVVTRLVALKSPAQSPTA